MSEKRIVKELLKIARDLVSNDPRVAGRNEVADTEGKYKNFTGIIKWGKSEGKVKNATFELENNEILWKNGTWEYGTWINGTWKNGYILVNNKFEKSITPPESS